jgi:hypothetical protein
MRSGNNAAIVAPIMGRAADPPKPRPNGFNDQAIFIALAAVPSGSSAQSQGAVERRRFASTFIKKSSCNFSRL